MKIVFKYLVLVLLLIFSGCEKASINVSKSQANGLTAKEILVVQNYPAISYGGYREKTRDDVPTVEDLKEDMQILIAMGVNSSNL